MYVMYTLTHAYSHHIKFISIVYITENTVQSDSGLMNGQ